ncbi:MAG: NADH-quinone oxidoreductase subunit L, partial [Dehalococcoidia bacterium]|nr:NADH-quinone oxidoreductase subunit L [Dehalococcoidia bacterium]
METESFSKELLVWLILFLPVGAFAINALIIRPFLGSTSRLAWIVTVAAMLAAVALSAYQFIQVRDAAEHHIQYVSHDWLDIGNFHLEIGLKVDSLTSIMLLVVTSVSTLVQIYSHGYMKEDGGYVRYFSYMSLFTASMLGIVLANNLVMLYAFWELVGLCSYLLIGFWFTRPAAANAAKKAFIVTRVGDVGFLLAILWTFHKTGTFNIDELTAMAASGAIVTSVATWLAIGAFAGAVGKSAQFPLNTWLP